ncbi:MAG TPA: PA domain-containing protein [Pyrinomonadaceae bacterium]|nr:PA domain-containing protein [Pyrinomonadaceae bacterium]
MKYLLNRVPILLLAAIVGLIVSSSAFGQATIVIENGDSPGVGFNDPTSVAPVGGNSGTTLGQQRLIAFQAAATIWGATVSSTPTITIHATWSSTMTCTASSGILGAAGNAGNIYRDFSGSVPGTWYGNALANALSGTDRNGASPEINATFNLNLGTSNCLTSLHWYYGLDNNHGSTGVDLVTVLIHEFAHGLGFQTFTSSSTGAQAFGFPSIYDRFLFDNTAGKTWAQMTTDAERQASAINTNNLVWNGPQVTTDVPAVLSSAGTPRLRVNSPPGIARNYSIGTATFGPALTSPGVTANVAQASPADGCTAIGAAVSGKIALIDRGPTGSPCAFVVKAKNAQDAGAVGVIIADNVSSSSPPGMSGSDPTITIPSVSITLADGNAIKAQLGSGVNATLLLDTSTFAGADQLGHALMFAPNPFVSGSSVSHWDSSEFPNQLMEPNINTDLSHSVTKPQDLTLSLLKDIGWPTGTPPPPPSPTPTPSPPPNDNFANAQVVSSCSGSVTGTNIAATKEAGEPNNPDSPTSTRSVWYRWQAPSTGSATIDTHGSDFDTVLAVYTGSSVNALTLVANNDDAVPNSDLTSAVTFSATQGTIYRIAVNGFDNSSNGGDTGNITLNWTESNCTPPPTILTEEGNTNSAAAVDSVTLVRGPFPIMSFLNFSSDHHTRVILFTSNLGLSAPGPSLTVQAGGTSLTVENVGTVSGVAGLNASYIVVRLPNGLPAGDLPLTVTLNGVASSNTPTISISP